MARLITLSAQYFLNDGTPNSGGLIAFFESGSTTQEKDTFSDINLSVANTNPLILDAFGRQSDVFFNGTARAIVMNSNGEVIDIIDPVGGGDTGGAFSDFNSITIYNIPDIVIASDDFFYKSITNGNQGNDPTNATAGPLNWEQIRFVGVFNLNQTYNIPDYVQASDGLIYLSLTDNNKGNDPVTDTTNWGGSSLTVLPDRVTSAASIFNFENIRGFD